MNKYILFIVAVIILNSCNNRPGPDYFDSICKDSLGFKVDSSRVFYVTDVNHEYLSIRSIAVPSDTFFMRVQYETDTTMRVFEYAFYKSRTSYKIYTFPADVDGRILFDKAKDRLADFVQHVGSSDIDNSFIAQLEKNNILELPNSDSLKGYPQDWDRSFVIEYSNRCRYSIVMFADPYQNSKNFKEAKSLVKFLKFLKKEFNF